MKPFFIIILGPTGVGKTDFSLDLARAVSGEVVNADMGQFYTALSIGTAKPDWRSYKDVPHHLFDLIEKPVDYSAFIFRNQCKDVISSITTRKHVPLVVGGSGFYGKSLLYSVTSPVSNAQLDTSSLITPGQSLWEQLHSIDPQRASKIHPNDTYRIERALQIWHSTGIAPSAFEPVFDPVGTCFVLFLDRNPEDLKARIAQRTRLMIDQGWIEEVKRLTPEWRHFAGDKFIGYQEIAELLECSHYGTEDVEKVINSIVARTHTYARRQRIFWRSLKKDLLQKGIGFEELNLTLLDHTLYINQLLEKITPQMTSGTYADK